MNVSFASAEPRLEIEEFRLIRDIVNRSSGICFGDDSQYLVERRLRDRVAALGLGSFAEYHQYLRYHPGARAELEEAIEALTLNETYFFREDYQLRAFKSEILPELFERAGGRASGLCVWSAGCSTGEEVYTIAMLILESGLFEGWDVKVFGNDINRRVLQHARRGIYGKGAFRVTPDSYRRSFFVERPDGMHVADRVRGMCHFGHLNLVEDDRIALIGRVDVVFCRNVLIYFDNEARRKVIDRFYERLLPGGYLLLGHSESLIHLSTSFEIVHLENDLVYRRPLARPLERP
ncbi:MAG: protein-glutamate O-methyltransferase CheR [Deltaproteobacteria bacterium]|nr:protein-glutamate O-methyltransferase CheR [Deltaproteobacteria bacterium]